MSILVKVIENHHHHQILVVTEFFLHQEANLEVEGGESLMKRGRESTRDRKLELNCKKRKRVFA